MDLESLKRRCAPRDTNDGLFAIPIAEVRELLDAYERLLAEKDEIWNAAAEASYNHPNDL